MVLFVINDLLVRYAYKNPRFRRKTKEEQAHYRVETLKALEAPTAEVPPRYVEFSVETRPQTAKAATADKS